MQLAQPRAPAPPLYPPGSVTAPPLQPITWVPAPPLEEETPPPWTGPEGPVGPPGPTGEVGPVGPQGEVGPVGPEGPQGDQGIQGPPGGAPAWKGDWSALTAYMANDAVAHLGSSFYAPSNVTIGVEPPAAPWQTIAEKGDQGVQGAIGPQGPQGAVGPTGSTGAQGPPGADSTVPGPPGPGVPIGGTTGQILNKTSATDYATAWTNVIVSQAMWDALVARVTTLEARPVINSIDDLVYGPA